MADYHLEKSLANIRGQITRSMAPICQQQYMMIGTLAVTFGTLLPSMYQLKESGQCLNSIILCSTNLAKF